jgi:hypothetical protein
MNPRAGLDAVSMTEVTFWCGGVTGKKVKLSLCLTKHHTMKTYWTCGGIAPCILDLGTRMTLVVSFTPRPIYPQERAPVTHWTGGWVDSRSGLDELC